jgi:hypothetical protein
MNHILKTRTYEAGAANTWLIVAIAGIVATVGLGAAFAWALINYVDQKDNVDTKVSSAVTEAVKKQADADAAAFEKEEKKPNRQFSGPEDFGAVSFDYPKTWSSYIANDASSGGTFEAYFHPVSVPKVASSEKYALRLKIETKDYDSTLGAYTNLVKRGDLQSSTIKINGVDSTRLDGSFSKDVRGSAVVLKIRDKTVTIQTDAETFKGDFDALVATIAFNS